MVDPPLSVTLTEDSILLHTKSISFRVIIIIWYHNCIFSHFYIFLSPNYDSYFQLFLENLKFWLFEKTSKIILKTFCFIISACHYQSLTGRPLTEKSVSSSYILSNMTRMQKTVIREIYNYLISSMFTISVRWCYFKQLWTSAVISLYWFLSVIYFTNWKTQLVMAPPNPPWSDGPGHQNSSVPDQ